MNTLLQVPRRDGVFRCMEIPAKLLEFSLRYRFFPDVHVLILDCLLSLLWRAQILMLKCIYLSSAYFYDVSCRMLGIVRYAIESQDEALVSVIIICKYVLIRIHHLLLFLQLCITSV
jgi:hypothetical protein